jgi:hypothetical protein
LLSIFMKQFGVRSTGSCGDPPINRADIVASGVGSHFVKLDAAASLAGPFHARQIGQCARLARHIDKPSRKSIGDQCV